MFQVQVHFEDIFIVNDLEALPEHFVSRGKRACGLTVVFSSMLLHHL